MAAYLEGKHHPHEALEPRAGFVANVGDTIVGYIAGHLTQRHACDGEVQYLFVEGPHRRTGIASHLLGMQFNWFREQGARRICVNVEPANSGARSFYSRHGATEFHPYWMIWPDIGTSVGGPL
jgi:GNAT superfamily N-acetyltransferase